MLTLPLMGVAGLRLGSLVYAAGGQEGAQE